MKWLINLGPTIMIGLGLLPGLSGLDYFLGLYQIIPVRPTFLCFFALLVTFIPFLVKSLMENKGREVIRLYRNTLRITAPLGLFAAIVLLYGLHPKTNWEEGGINVYLDFFGWVILLMALGIANLKFFRENYRIIIFFILVFSGGSIIFDALWPGTLSDRFTRAGGFTGNSNTGAMVANFLLITVINWRKHDLWNLLSLVFVGICVAFSLSISGILAYLIIAGAYVYFVIWSGKVKAVKTLVTVGFLLLAIFVFKPILNEFVRANMDLVFDESQRHRVEKIFGMEQGDFSVVRDHERVDIARFFLKLAMDDPLIGHGTGFSASYSDMQSTHNMYLKYWVDNGILGLLSYISIIVGGFFHFRKWGDTRGLVFIAVVGFTGFFTHNLTWHRPFPILLGLLGSLAYLENFRETEVEKPKRVAVYV